MQQFAQIETLTINDHRSCVSLFMHIRLHYRLPASIIAFLLSFSTWALPGVSISPVPNWVLPVKVGGHIVANKDITAGYFVTLYDTQVHVEKQASFVRLVREIRTSTGVQNGSEISIYFDPTYQKLSLHEVVIIRQGKRINKLSAEVIKIVPIETERSQFIYNGSYIASLLLTDVRPNDQIAYSYTLTGRNPVFAGRFAQTFYFSTSDPLPNRHHALLVAADRKLSFKSENNPPKPVVSKQENLVVYDWQAYDLKPALSEEYVPGWINTEAYVQVSEWQQWSDVASWATGITNNAALPQAMQQLVDQWTKKANGNPLRFAKQAVAFVQDEVRYVGIELGENSHRPHSPTQVFQQRYGDCKDKSLLLCSLLQAYGIPASIALTNSYLSSTMPSYLPDPGVFNHAIVRAEINGKPTWIDPTIANQRGEKTDFYCPDYKYALILRAGERQLTAIPFQATGRIVMNETYWIPSSVGEQPGYLSVHSRYSGYCADAVRGHIAQQGKAEVEKTYLDFYQQSMRDQVIDAEQPLYEDDDPTLNTFITQERYKINNVWQSDSSSTAKSFTLLCRAFVHELRSLTARKRVNPLALSYPYDIDYTVRVHLPEVWMVEADSWTIDRKAYTCSFKKTYQPEDSLVTLHYTYRNKIDYVEQADIATYRADVDKIDRDLSIQLTQDLSGASSGATNWLLVLVSLITIGLGGYVSWKLYQRDIEPASLSPSSPLAIGGWLILLAVGLPSSIITLTYDILSGSDEYRQTTQDAMWLLGGIKSYVGVATLYFETTINWLLWWGAILATVLFYQRRTTFPRYFTVLLFVRFLFMVADVAITNNLFPTNQPSLSGLSNSVFGVLIWIPYLAKSTRVRRTFLRLYNGTNWVPLQQATLVNDTTEGTATL